MRKSLFYYVLVLLGMLLLGACGKNDGPEPTDALSPTPEITATPEPTVTPEPTKAPSPTPMGAHLPEGINLKNTYGKTFGRVGTCFNATQLSDISAWKVIDEQYNSITLENEMKPDAILGNNSKTISIDEAKALGYVIPENYKEATVPELNFRHTDRAIEFCVKHDLGLRGHTLVWHSQTPGWFFREGYDSKGELVTPEVMDARLEFYIRTVMGHVYDQENGELVYSWDVLNEYVHADGHGWKEVYGNEGLEPGFARLAFEIADDVLKQYGLQDKVTLLYNDFNTYSDTTGILKLVAFINANEKLCDGIGMQSHLKTSFPTASSYLYTVKKFLEEGYEVQITELDVGNTNDLMQGLYYYDIMKGLLEIKQNGGNITGITWWGLADICSWRGDEKPLMFKTMKTPKLAYYKVLDAYVDAGLYTAE